MDIFAHELVTALENEILFWLRITSGHTVNLDSVYVDSLSFIVLSSALQPRADSRVGFSIAANHGAASAPAHVAMMGASSASISGVWGGAWRGYGGSRGSGFEALEVDEA